MPASHSDLANALRFLSIDAVEAAKSGHPGMPMGMADVATVLFTRFLKFNPAQPSWPDRDRFVLSAGHGSMLLYALSHLTGYSRMTLDEIKRFRQLGSITPGHPEHDIGLGIETTTGPLGQGLATAVGMALGERILNAEFGDELVDHHTYVIASDGDMMEGISHEAASIAGHLKLSRLIVLYDDNKICIDGPTALSFSDNTEQRFEAYGWHTMSIDGHDAEAIAHAIEAAHKSDRPTLICCRTTIGFGAPNKQGTAATHGSPLGADEVKAARENLHWPHAPFEIPAEIAASWHNAGARHAATTSAWQARLQAHPRGTEFTRRINGPLPAALDPAFAQLKQETLAAKAKIATRQSSGNVLAAIMPALPELLGGSADLTPSNNTKTKDNSPAISAGQYAGRYIHWGIREHGMAAAMNGLALHGGFIPYSGTFLTFADYCRPAIRLSALMGQRVVYVMTHDSIGLGEDGPTHQPVEHLASLRAIPNLLVMRPCDTIETAECWQAALNSTSAPTVLVLSRQNLPLLRTEAGENMAAKGGYVLAESAAPRQVTLLATGSEVALAMAAREELTKAGINAAVVSMPCFALFEQQPLAYRHQVLGTAPRVAVEAAISQGWDYYLGDKGAFIGMNSFGASAPAEALYSHFGITVDAVVNAAKGLL